MSLYLMEGGTEGHEGRSAAKGGGKPKAGFNFERSTRKNYYVGREAEIGPMSDQNGGMRYRNNL